MHRFISDQIVDEDNDNDDDDEPYFRRRYVNGKRGADGHWEEYDRKKRNWRRLCDHCCERVSPICRTLCIFHYKMLENSSFNRVKRMTKKKRKISDIDQSSQIRKIILSISSTLNRPEIIDQINRFIEKFSSDVQWTCEDQYDYVDDTTTHLLSDDQGAFSTTMSKEVIQACVRHVFVSSISWIQNSLEQSSLLDYFPFEILRDDQSSPDSRGIKHCRFNHLPVFPSSMIFAVQCFDGLEPLKISRNELIELIELSGATLFNQDLPWNSCIVLCNTQEEVRLWKSDYCDEKRPFFFSKPDFLLHSIVRHEMNFTRSYLEIFPDELFLELFSYISPVDLYSVWFGQNRRFNAILRSVRISFDLFEKSPLVSQALKHFADQIVYLHFRVSDPNFDFRHFPKIRSLHIDSALTKEQLESIHPHILPSLERVTFSAYLPETDWFSEQILLRHSQVEQKKKWIEVYRLPRLPSTLKKSPERFSHIHSIIIDRATMNDVDLLLFLFTSLRRLKVTIVPRSIERLKIPMRCMEKPLFTHPLLHLHITMNTFDKLDEFYPLLARLASLKSLYIACDNLSMIDFQQLAIALHRDAPALRTFNCSFQQTYFEDMSQIHNLSPLFRRMKCQRVDLCGGWYYHCITTQGR